MNEVERSAFRVDAELCAFDFDEPSRHGKVLWQCGPQPSCFSQHCNLDLGPTGAEPAFKTLFGVRHGFGTLKETLPSGFD
jgi:hypothetical protein